MTPLPLPALLLALARLAPAIAHLWTIVARLASQATAPSFTVAPLAEEARQALGELRPLRDRLAQIAADLPHPSFGTLDIELPPLELARASLECVLADRLDLAITSLATTSGIVEQAASVELARVGLQCVLVDHLLPAIAALTAVLILPDQETTSC
jgi:hypothetical protein